MQEEVPVLKARLGLLDELSHRLAAAATLEEMFEAALDPLIAGVRIDRASLLLFDDQGVMRFCMWRGLSDEYRRAVDGHSPWRVGERNPQKICITDAETDPEAGEYRSIFLREGIRALGFFPLVARGELIGKFMIYANQPTVWNEGELGFVETVAASVALAVALTRAEQSSRAAKLELEKELAERQLIEGHLIEAQRLDSLGHLAGSVAHDFNNLLTPILGYGEIVREQIERGQAKVAMVEALIFAAQRAAAITSQLLAFARRQPVSPEIVDLRQFLQSSLELLRRLLGPGIDLVLTDRSRNPLVRADPTQLQQVLINLLANARDAMPQGGELRLELAETHFSESTRIGSTDLPAGEYVVLAVHDQGSGMDPATARRIFEPFFTTKEKGRGTGLGLSTCYGIVHQSGGAIAVDSILGRGSVFSVYLPQRGQDEKCSSLAHQRSAEGAGKKILVVDDENEVRRVLVEMLRLRGFETLEAGDGLAALALLREGATVDLVLSDVLMPKMGGEELHRHVKAEFPKLRYVFISGFTEGRSLDPQVPFVGKPLRAAELFEALDRAFAIPST